MKKTYSKLQRTIELANLALEIAKENLFINMTMPNRWEVVVLDQDGFVTNHKLVKDLNNKEILLWINKWTANYEITKMWRSKRIHSHNICYS